VEEGIAHDRGICKNDENLRIFKFQPFYAVKCNTDPVLVRTLAALDVGFDCASAEEIDIVMNMGVQPGIAS